MQDRLTISLGSLIIPLCGIYTVSYTHLDVYKRQILSHKNGHWLIFFYTVPSIRPVSYTHLDVYKRQIHDRCGAKLKLQIETSIAEKVPLSTLKCVLAPV